jgi:hypothetical protein
MHVAIRISLCALLFMALQPAYAGPVYTWTDPAGITHFSELPPPGQNEAIQLDLPPYPAATGPYGDYYSVINQAARMEAQRLERERLEAQRRQLEAETLRAQAEALAASTAATPVPPPVSYRYPPWYPYPGHHPRHHRHHPYPQHREHYPPHRPDGRYDLRLNRPPAMTLPGNR